MQLLFLTPWPALLVLPVSVFAMAMAAAGIAAASGSGGLSAVIAVVLGTVAGTAAGWGLGLALGLAAPSLFDAAFALERTAAFAPFGFLGGVAGVASERGYALSSLWR